MNLPSNDDMHLLAGAFAVDAVDEVERRRFEQHLRSCATCTDDVIGFREAAVHLGVAVAERPPVSLKIKVMADVDRTRQVSALRSRPSQLHRRVPQLVAVAAAVAALAVGTTAFVQRERSHADRAAARIVRAPDAQIVHLAGNGGSAHLTYSAKLGAGVLVADELKRAPAGHTYQLWVVDNGTPISVGTFDGAAKEVEMEMDGPPPVGAVIAVTDEPAGGSTKPTTPPILTSQPA